ncbi:MAG: hypothetical protein Q9211_001245 [Gyalolechia sp. 1 TL-2023]
MIERFALPDADIDVEEAEQVATLSKTVSPQALIPGLSILRAVKLKYIQIGIRTPASHTKLSVVSGANIGTEETDFCTRGSQHSLQTLPRLSFGFVFIRQGAQWPQMGRQLLGNSLTFARTIDRMLRSLQKHPSWTIKEALLEPAATSKLGAAAFSQPLCTTVQLGIMNVLRSWNVKPAVVVGLGMQSSFPTAAFSHPGHGGYRTDQMVAPGSKFQSLLLSKREYHFGTGHPRRRSRYGALHLMYPAKISTATSSGIWYDFSISSLQRCIFVSHVAGSISATPSQPTLIGSAFVEASGYDEWTMGRWYENLAAEALRFGSSLHNLTSMKMQERESNQALSTCTLLQRTPKSADTSFPGTLPLGTLKAHLPTFFEHLRVSTPDTKQRGSNGYIRSGSYSTGFATKKVNVKQQPCSYCASKKGCVYGPAFKRARGAQARLFMFTHKEPTPETYGKSSSLHFVLYVKVWGTAMSENWHHRESTSSLHGQVEDAEETEEG